MYRVCVCVFLLTRKQRFHVLISLAIIFFVYPSVSVTKVLEEQQQKQKQKQKQIGCPTHTRAFVSSLRELGQPVRKLVHEQWALLHDGPRLRHVLGHLGVGRRDRVAEAEVHLEPVRRGRRTQSRPGM